MSALLARRRVLSEETSEEPHWETRDTGKVFRSVWSSSSPQARAAMMQSAGLVVRIDPAGGLRLPVGERARIEPDDPAAQHPAAIEAEEMED